MLLPWTRDAGLLPAYQCLSSVISTSRSPVCQPRRAFPNSEKLLHTSFSELGNALTKFEGSPTGNAAKHSGEFFIIFEFQPVAQALFVPLAMHRLQRGLSIQIVE